MKRATIRKLLSALAAAPVVAASAGLAWAQGATNHVRDVRVHASDGDQGTTEIEVVGTSQPTFNVRVEDGGRRLLVDLGNADVVGQPTPVTRPVGVVAGLLTQAFPSSTGSMTRLSVNLARKASYRVKAEGNVLRVILVPGPTTEAQAGAPRPGASPEPAPKAAASTLTDVQFRREKGCVSLCDRLELRTSQAPAYAVTAAPDGKLRLELRRTTASADALKTLDLASQGGVLRTATVTRDESSGSVFVELEREGSAQGVLSIEGGTLVWAFDLPEGGPRRAVKGKGPRSSTVAREEAHDAGPRPTQSWGEGAEVEVTDGRAAGFASPTSGVRAQAAGRYAGRRIDLDLKDADIHNVLRLLADVGKVNIVTADDVAGSVTIRMRNVPWDQALDVVLQAKGLGMVRQGNLIRVAPMAQLQRERELKLAAAKQEYELTPLETRLIPVSYAQADELSARAKDLLSPRGSIAVDERTNVLIARDVTGNLNNIEELVRSLDTQTPQVLVEARIVEATSRYVRDIGIQWGGDATFSEATGNPTGIAFPSRASVAGGNYDPQTPTAGISPFQRQVATPNFAVNLPAAVGTGQGGALGFSLGSVDNNFNLGIRLSAAEASGLLRIVSSPRILTLDNRDARISQGTLIPFAQISAQGVQTTFQEAKLQLLVRPHVTADGSISMHVKINRDEPDFNQTSPRGDPTILKREAETDLLVQDGHTAVIGGIYTRNTGKNVDQVPFFGDIPILGVLFQRRRANDTRNELVIFLTPRIVNRAEALGR